MAVKVIKRKETALQVPEIGKRTVCYVRVSSLSDEQAGSYSSQISHFETMIQNDPELEYSGTYGDEGVTGTSLEHREGFKQMMRDAEDHKFDQIYTKSISRFGRNVLDSLVSLRRLKELGINVRFFKEGISTMDGTGELLILILSSLSQAESQSISENVKMGIRYRFQEGKPFINCNHFLGYDKKDGRLVINPEQAAIVRRIFADFLNGHSADMIAATLTREQVPTVTGGTTWYPSAVRYIISNEKYKGDLRLQKTVVPNFLTHRPKKNTGEADQFYVENSHDPIVPPEVFDMAQAEAARRAAKRLNSDGSRSGGIKYGSRNALQGRCRCTCGDMMKRRKGKYTRWFCPTCKRSVRESDIHSTVLEAFRKLDVEEGNLTSLLCSTSPARTGTTSLPNTTVDTLQGSNTRQGATTPASTGLSTSASMGSNIRQGAVQTAPLEEQRAAPVEQSEVQSLASALFKRYHILSALDWIHNGGKESLMAGGTCYTLTQFIDVTRPAPLTGWSDETVLRFVEGIEVGDEIAVHFRAGVTVSLPVSKRVFSTPVLTSR